jgi:hypothetical protein
MKPKTITDEERDKILLKIRKLVDLAENAKKIGSEGEAYAAAQGVHRLLTMYNLTIDEVPIGEEKKPSIDITETDMFSYANSYGTWQRELLIIICMYNYCRCLVNTFSKRMCIVGEQQNVIIVKQLFEYLVKSFKRLAQEKWVTTVTSYGANCYVCLPFEVMEKRYGKEKKSIFFRSYFKGAGRGLMAQFRSLQPTSEETALMVRHDDAINEYLSHDDNYTGKKTKNYPEKGNIDNMAFFEGFSDGKNISLHKQISSQK